MTIRLVCFDLGRVLIRICDDWDHACEQAGVDPPIPALNHTATAALHHAVARHEIGELDHLEFCIEAAAHVGVTPAQMEAISLAFLRGPFEGVAPMLDDLHAAGLATACLSNTNACHWRLMGAPAGRHALPLDRLTHRFASHLIGHRKPDAAIYHYVEQTTGVPPRAIAFFDDLRENVAAAQSRGWQAHRITPDRSPVDQVREHLAAYGVLREQGAAQSQTT